MRLSRFLAPNPATRIPSGATRPPTWALPGMPTALAQLLEAATAMLPATVYFSFVDGGLGYETSFFSFLCR
jgi:hypothetical protein